VCQFRQRPTVHRPYAQAELYCASYSYSQQ
jgi:hypothetical protein